MRPFQNRGHSFEGTVAQSGGRRIATLDWVDWLNHRQLLQPIGYVPPAEYEARYYEQAALA